MKDSARLGFTRSTEELEVQAPDGRGGVDSGFLRHCFASEAVGSLTMRIKSGGSVAVAMDSLAPARSALRAFDQGPPSLGPGERREI
jgi:hypothetical protein